MHACTWGCRALQRPCRWRRQLTAVAAVASTLPGTTKPASSHLHPRAVLGCKGIAQPCARPHASCAPKRTHAPSTCALMRPEAWPSSEGSSSHDCGGARSTGAVERRSRPVWWRHEPAYTGRESVVRLYGAARERPALRRVLHNRMARSLREGDAHQVRRSRTHDQEPLQESGLAVAPNAEILPHSPCSQP